MTSEENTDKPILAQDDTYKESAKLAKEVLIRLGEKALAEYDSKHEHDFDAIYKTLHGKFPTIINMDKPVLLAIAIRGEILKEVTIPNAILHKWIGWYFRKSKYYFMHKVGAVRYNLDGSEAGAVTEKDQTKRDKQIGKIKAENPKDKSKSIEGEKQKNKKPASEADNKEAKSH